MAQATAPVPDSTRPLFWREVWIDRVLVSGWGRVGAAKTASGQHRSTPPVGSVASDDVDYALSGSLACGRGKGVVGDRPVALPGMGGDHRDRDPAD